MSDDKPKYVPPNLAFGWDKGNLVIRSDDVLERYSLGYLSPSTAKSMEGCAASWAASRLMRVEEDPFGAAELGTSAHAVLEDLMQLPGSQRSEDTAMEILISHAGRQWPDADDAVQRNKWIIEVHNAYRGLFDIEDPREVVVKKTEMEAIDVKVGGVPFRGYIDRVDFTPDGLRVVDYKGLALDTPIPTPEGWTTMGDLREGDYVLGTEGRPTRVVGKSTTRNRPCYRFTFSDGTSVISDDEHKWQVTELDSRGNHTTSVADAATLAARLDVLREEGRSESLVISNAAPLDLPEVALPIDPWLLGAWLGDGTAEAGAITVGTEDVEDMLTLIKGAWHGTVIPREQSGGGYAVSVLRPDVAGERYNVSLGERLREEGLLRNKHVPTAYLRASYDQRLALLRGLMDTGGSWSDARRRAVFVSTNERLADAVAELVATFGVNAQRHKVWVENDCWAFTVEFRPVGFNPFALPRKAIRVDEFRSTADRQAATRRTIVSIDKVESVPTQCIMVDAEDSMYLCGPALTPTHNSGKVPNLRFGDAHGDQILLYAEVLWELEGQRPVEGALYYTRHGKSRVVDLSRKKAEEVLARFQRSWTDLRSHVASASFPTKTSALCGWCPLVNSCPAARADGKTDRKGGAASQADLGIPILKTFDASELTVQARKAAQRRPQSVFEPDFGATEEPSMPDPETDTPVDVPDDPVTVSGSGPEEEPARPGSERDGSAHLSGDQPTTREKKMSNTEGKPWQETVDGALNLASYAATAVFGTTSLAYGTLVRAGAPLNRVSIDSLAATYAYMVSQAQKDLTGDASYQDAANTRLRGALHAYVEAHPAPFGENAATWDEWVDRGVKHIASIGRAAIRLYDADLDTSPWRAFAAS